MRKRVRSFYDSLYQNKTVFDEEEVLCNLPPIMATELVNFMYQKEIKLVPIFQGLEDEVITKLCLGLKPYPAAPNDAIMREGEQGNEMFIITRGRVQVRRTPPPL